MSVLEYAFMVKELAPKVTGKHFNRIRKLADGVYRLKIGSTEILCELGTRMHETMLIEPTEQTDKFAEKTAKELDNARLLAVAQINNDRIISFEFDRASLIFEMFGDGNAILVRDGKTIAAASYGSWSDREIKPGAPYSPPKNATSGKLEPSDRYIIVSLMKLPFGKEYAAEALARAGIDEKTPGVSLKPEQLARLEKELSDIAEAASPVLFMDSASGKPVDFSLAPLARYSKLETRNLKTLSEAADAYYSAAERPNPELDKLQKRLEKQQERMLELQGEERQERAMGDYIYANYQQAERIIQLAKSGEFSEIEAKYKGKADKKEKSVEVEL
jgi:predicted ribosome quality control (RQC) complex YloA/Tae2 family protein